MIKTSYAALGYHVGKSSLDGLDLAFMGILRKTGHINCLASATGAKRDSSGGVIYLP